MVLLIPDHFTLLTKSK